MKFFSAYFILACACIIACSKETNQKKSLKEQIIGDWVQPEVDTLTNNYSVTNASFTCTDFEMVTTYFGDDSVLFQSDSCNAMYKTQKIKGSYFVNPADIFIQAWYLDENDEKINHRCFGGGYIEETLEAKIFRDRLLLQNDNLTFSFKLKQQISCN